MVYGPTPQPFSATTRFDSYYDQREVSAEEIYPDEVTASQIQEPPRELMYRLLEVLTELSATVPEIENMHSALARDRANRLTKLFGDSVSNQNWQAASHLGAAALCLFAGVAATKTGFDGASAITVTSKLGDATSTWLRGTETGLQGDRQRLEHELNKGPDKRLNEFLQQFMRNAETISQQRGRIRSAG